MVKSSLISLDAFSKTEEDVRVRTRSGALITLGCVVVTIMLLFSEWTQLQHIVNRPQLVLDRDRQLKLDINLDISFPNMPCELLALDIVDDSREVQLDLLQGGFTKTRLDSHGKPISTDDYELGSSNVASLLDIPEDYCGPCYGALDQAGNADLQEKDRVCCQTCEEVREAYAAAGWAFFDGTNIEQCEREGYVDVINRHLHEGCRVRGQAKLNRIQGNIHFAPGTPIKIDNSMIHSHDSSLFEKHIHLSFNHIIHSLSFGPPVVTPDKSDSAVPTGPLDGHTAIFDDPLTAHFRIYSYYAKIVPTRYESINGIVTETAEFSATAHDRPLRGGRDNDHPNTFHMRGGISSLIIYFEISPLKVINREQYAAKWSTFLLNSITSIGGVLAVGTVVDRIMYRAQRTIWGKKKL